MIAKEHIETTSKKLGDYYWDYADIMRGLGIKEGVYDERILGFMALKLLIDNNKLFFNFNPSHGWKFCEPNKIEQEYIKHTAFQENPFNCQEEHIVYIKNTQDIAIGINYSETFKTILKNIKHYDMTNYFYKKDTIKDNEQWKLWNITKYNVDSEIEIINNKNVFTFDKYIDELLGDEKFLSVLEIYENKANFVGYPRNKYKNLYEDTVTRMKKLSGSLTGQHFTQNCIIDFMTEIGVEHLDKTKKEVVIFDPACGVGSMLYESAYYAANKIYGCKKDEEQTDDNCILKHFLLLGQEINGPTWFLAKVFSEISGFKNFIAFGNTLTEPFINTFNGNIDFIIANPPFGMDWKTEEKIIKKLIEDNVVIEETKDEKGKIIDILIKENNSPYKLFSKNVKEWYVLPKISDGQYLFFMQILKLQEKHKGKAVVISSTSPASNGKVDSSEGIIRKGMIENGFVDTIIEQPNAMFTNTDIKTHIWILNSLDGEHEKQKNKVNLIQLDNDKMNKPFTNGNGKILKRIKVLYSDSDYKIDKQKYGYSKKNIEDILSLYKNINNFDLFKKVIYFNSSSDYAIDFNVFNDDYNKLEYKCDILNLDNIQLIEEYLLKTLLYGIGTYELTNKINKYISKELFAEQEYFEKYENLYLSIFDKNKKSFDIFLKEYIEQEIENCKDIMLMKDKIAMILKDSRN